jgi:hypothetical protein
MKRHLVKHVSYAALAIATLVTFAACKKDATDTKKVEVPKVPPPAGLLLEASLPKLKGGAAGLGAYADQLQPGIGGMLDMQLGNVLAMVTEMPSFDGAKADAPVRVLVMDPKKGQHAAALVGVEDEKKLRESAKTVTIHVKDGFALVGDKETVEALDGYAFGTLAKQPAPEAPGALLYVPQLLVSYKTDMEAFFAQMGKTFDGQASAATMGNLMKIYADGVLGLLERSEVIEVRLNASKDNADLDIAFTAKPGSELALFIAAQKPATGKLLERLPAGSAALVMDANLALGPLREKIRPMIHEAMAQFAGVALDDKMHAALDTMLDQFSGEFSMAGDMMGAQGMRMSQLARVSDPAKALAASKAFFDVVAPGGSKTNEVMGIKMTVSVKADAGSHDGVSFISYDTKPDFSSLPPEVAASQKAVYGADGMMHTLLAGFDDTLAVTIGGDAATAMPGLIDAARGKAPRLELNGDQKKLVDDSHARGESVFYAFDIGKLMQGAMVAQGAPPPAADAAPAPVVMALGFKDGRAHLRIAVPVATLTAIKNMQQSAMQQQQGGVVGGDVGDAPPQ